MDMFSIFLALSGNGPGQSYNLTGATILDFSIDPSTALAGIRFHHNGTVQSLSPSTAAFHDDTDWLIPHRDNVGALFQVRWTNHSGDALTTEASAVNVWIDINVSRTYSIFADNIGQKNSTQTFQIRRKSDNETVASAVIILSTDIEAGG